MIRKKEKQGQKLPDIINLLPDSVANQIAAGEVIQRPASVVKELMENAVDAGSTAISLIVKDAGKTLIQVADNGCGMSETDARMCFERHATSKIREANDLFAIKSMGFRGEALASIAAIAQVNLVSKRTNEELGTEITIEGSEVISQEPCSHSAGTSISVKNLFYNVPARRKFLKSDPVEIKHIIDEFQRLALPNPSIQFSLHHNGNEIFHLEQGSARQRIVGIFGKKYNDKLVPVDEDTNIVKLKGFTGKPEAAKRTKGEQFFFVNSRFIKSHYLHHAVQGAFEQLIPANAYPCYFLNLEMDPQAIDINIHPTKTEIKFEDEKAIYAIIRSAVKKSLGKYNIAPSLDFEREAGFDLPHEQLKKTPKEPGIRVNPEYNPFEEGVSASKGSLASKLPKLSTSRQSNWEQLFTDNTEKANLQPVIQKEWGADELSDESARKQLTHQLHNKYILTNIRSGFMVIHQQRAHARILYEQFLKGLDQNSSLSQQQLFPQNVELSRSDAELVKELQPEIKGLGFDIREFGNNSFVIHGLPTEATDGNPREMIESILEHYKKNLSELKLDKRESLARSMASNIAIRTGRKLEDEEMRALIDELFACEIPHTSPNGKLIISLLTLEDLDQRFE